MCGICGVYAPKMTAKEVDVFRSLLAINAYRGVDSTGVLRVNDKGQHQVLRAVVPSTTYLKSKQGLAFTSHEEHPQLLLGHCRAATIGSISPSNAHPFTMPNVVGVMNGTFKGDFEHSKDFETDTEAIYHNISEKGLVEGLKASMVYDPAYVLVFYDKKESTLNFIKNDKRPLAFSFIANRTALAWSSDEDHLKWVLNWHEFGMSGWNAKGGSDTFTLNENDLLTIKIGQSPTKNLLVHHDIPKKVWSTAVRPTRKGVPWYEVGFDENGLPLPKEHDKDIAIKRSDGQYRTDEEERRRQNQEIERFEQAFRSSNQQVEDVSPTEDAEDDGTTLSWLKRNRPGVSPPPATERYTPMRPQTPKEMAIKLKSGCVCCGTIVHMSDIEEVKHVHWYNRDIYCCETCFEFSEGDWIKCSFNPEWAGIVAKATTIIVGGEKHTKH